MIKLVAIDLDGTLLNNDRKISTENKEAIKKAKDLGIKIVVCTGRPLLSVVDILEELNLRELDDYVITYNGGLVQLSETGKVVSQQTLTKKEAADLYALSQELNVPCSLIDLENIYELPHPEGRESWYPKTEPALPFVSATLDDFSDDHTFNKIIYCYETSTLNEALANIPEAYLERYSCVKSRPILFEMMKKGVSKATGIAVLCELLSIDPEEVMALGDEENDLSMIEFSGMGVAMENATIPVKEKAQYITKTNEAHGVAHAMEKLIFQQV